MSTPKTIELEGRPSAPRAYGPATHERVRGLHVLRLRGTPYEMGRQHGALLAAEVAAGPVPYFRGVVRRLLENAPLGGLSPVLWPAFDRLIRRRVAKGLPAFATDTIRGIADGSGVSYDELLDGCTMPDALVWAVSRVAGLRGPGPAVAHRLALGLGCTSALAWGDATRDGRLYHGRNFDYHGVGTWPRSQAVVFHEPERGQRYVSIAAAGVGLGGITAMNEAGLTLTVHQHMFTDQARLGGTPIGVTGDVVMREARSLDDAERILRGQRPCGCWTYVVSDGHRKEVLAWEESPSLAKAIRTGPRDTTFAYSNVYLDEELGRTELALYGSYWRHNGGRLRAARRALREGEGALDAAAIAAVLADPGDPRCRLRDSIAMVMTVASVVFRPEDGAFWVATGEAPTSRGAFVPFSLGARGHAPELGELSARPGEVEGMEAAFEELRRAYVAYVDDEDAARARAHAEAACALAPEQALYHALAGLFALQALDAARAEAAFERALALGHPDPERVAGFHLWRGRARDLAGRRADAVRDYRAALGHRADPPVHAAARRDLSAPYAPARARRVAIDVAFADVVSP